MECRNCGQPIKQNQYGGWVHHILDLTFCHLQFPQTVYNNWDNRVARPKENSATE